MRLKFNWDPTLIRILVRSFLSWIHVTISTNPVPIVFLLTSNPIGYLPLIFYLYDMCSCVIKNCLNIINQEWDHIS